MQSEWTSLLVWQQDYFWFLAGMGWVVLALLGRLKPGELPAWTVPVAVGGTARSLLEILWHLSSVDDFSKARAGWDLGLSAVEAVPIAGLLYTAFSRIGRRRARALAFSISIVLLVLAFVWREADPLAGGWLILALSAAAATGAWLARPPRQRWTGVGLILLGLQPLLGASGPMGPLLGQIRTWMALSSLGGYAAIAQIVGAGFLCIGLSRESSVARLYLIRREATETLLAVSCWMGLGLVLASWSGRDARLAFEKSLVARARAGLAAINPEQVRQFLAEGLNMGREVRYEQPSGDVSVLRHVDFSPKRKQFQALRAELGAVDAANPEVQWSHLMTLQDGELLSYAFSPRVPGVDDVVAITRKATRKDEEDWKERRTVVEVPLLIAWGQLARVRVPITDPKAGMLGWLALDFGVMDWISVQGRARVQAFMIVGLGTILAGAWFLHRLRSSDRQNAMDAAQLAERENQSKTLFLAKVSHELRTPLQSILGYGYLLQRAELGELHRQYLEAINAHGELLARLVNDLIDLAALELGSFPLVARSGNLAELMRHTVESFRPAADMKGLELALQIESAFSEWRKFDPARVRQLLSNIVGNAVKYTVAGSVRVRLAAGADRDMCSFSVSDTGPGIPPEEIPLLFQPFRRLEATSASEGSGLGLALAAAICRSMDGVLSVESNGQSGSVFTATFRAPVSAAPASGAAEAPPRRLLGRQIVVADDNQLVRELFMAYLRGEGATCVEAMDGQAALDRCGEGAIDTLVIDLSMPRIDGYEATARLRASRPGLRIVGVSAHVNGPERERAIASGMNEFLPKPVTLEGLVSAIVGGSTAAVPPEPHVPASLRLKWAMLFREELPGQLAGLEQALRDKDMPLVRRVAHHLKNSSDVVGLPSISETLQRIISLSERGDPTQLRVSVERLLRDLRSVGRVDFPPGPKTGSVSSTKPNK